MSAPTNMATFPAPDDGNPPPLSRGDLLKTSLYKVLRDEGFPGIAGNCPSRESHLAAAGDPAPPHLLSPATPMMTSVLGGWPYTVPRIDTWAEQALDEANFILPPVLIPGMLHQGSKMILGSGSKCYKTWTLMDLAISLANGVSWLGKPCAPSSVLYVNMEGARPFTFNRFRQIEKAKGITVPSPNLRIWNLSGYNVDVEQLANMLEWDAKHESPSQTVIADPLYKFMGGRDENSANLVTEVLNQFERIARKCQSAVVFAAHFAKGNASSKEPIDRVSGSGAFARDPDSIVMMTPHEADECFTVESILRNFPPQAKFTVRREHPLMVRDDTLDPEKLKPVGNQAKYSIEEILAFLPSQGSEAGGMKTVEWQRAAKEELGVAASTFYQFRAEAISRELVIEESKRFFRKSGSPIDGETLPGFAPKG